LFLLFLGISLGWEVLVALLTVSQCQTMQCCKVQVHATHSLTPVTQTMHAPAVLEQVNLHARKGEVM
jgi:hypothetical protein